MVTMVGGKQFLICPDIVETIVSSIVLVDAVGLSRLIVPFSRQSSSDGCLFVVKIDACLVDVMDEPV